MKMFKMFFFFYLYMVSYFESQYYTDQLRNSKNIYSPINLKIDLVNGEEKYKN